MRAPQKLGKLFATKEQGPEMSLSGSRPRRLSALNQPTMAARLSHMAYMYTITPSDIKGAVKNYVSNFTSGIRSVEAPEDRQQFRGQTERRATRNSERLPQSQEQASRSLVEEVVPTATFVGSAAGSMGVSSESEPHDAVSSHGAAIDAVSEAVSETGFH